MPETRVYSIVTHPANVCFLASSFFTFLPPLLLLFVLFDAMSISSLANPTKPHTGGPGSSSLYGFLEENGPLVMRADGGLLENPWSWTKVANFIALESPVGVGYSYCEVQTQGHKCRNTDKFTASASRAALQDFFHNKFPELAQSDFFITGESYAGIYIPTLTKELLDHAPDIRLMGIAVGDPCTDNTAQADSMDALWYVRRIFPNTSERSSPRLAFSIDTLRPIYSSRLSLHCGRYGHKYGLVDDAIYDLLWNKCEARSPNLLRQGGVHYVAHQWNEHLKLKRIELEDDREFRDYARALRQQLILDNAGQHVKMTPDCQLAYRKFLMSTSHGLSQSWHDLYIDDYSLFAPVTSKEDQDLFAYMSRLDVRKALHVQDAPTPTWPYPDVGFDYSTCLTNYHWIPSRSAQVLHSIPHTPHTHSRVPLMHSFSLFQSFFPQPSSTMLAIPTPNRTHLA